jgi:hypothetical protein
MPVKTRRARRTTFVPYALRKGVAVELPLFGPASITREDAQARLDTALATGNFVSGSIKEIF